MSDCIFIIFLLSFSFEFLAKRTPKDGVTCGPIMFAYVPQRGSHDYVG